MDDGLAGGRPDGGEKVDGRQEEQAARQDRREGDDEIVDDANERHVDHDQRDAEAGAEDDAPLTRHLRHALHRIDPGRDGDGVGERQQLVVRVFGPRISGTSAATIGIIRMEESVTARKAAAILAPLAIELTRIILAGRAQTMPTMKTT